MGTVFRELARTSAVKRLTPYSPGSLSNVPDMVPSRTSYNFVIPTHSLGPSWS